MQLERIAICSAFLTSMLCAGCGEPSRFGTLPDAEIVGPRLTFLPAGLDVESAPAGWTDLVVKFVPDLTVVGAPAGFSEDLAGSSFRHLILADVKKPERTGGDYTLRAVGVGLSLPIDGKDTVVTMGSREKQGVALTKASKFALFAAEENMHQSSLLAKTATFALIGTRAHLKIGGDYRKIQLRYAISVDPKTGAISRFVWPVDGTRAGPSMVELSGDPTIHVPTHVVIDRAGGRVPKGILFGMTELPKGPSRPLTAQLAPLFANDRYSPELAAKLEQEVRSAMTIPSGVASSK